MTKEECLAACDILKYIQKRPNAKHTSEGIAKYWTFQQRLEEKLDIVISSIRYLVKEGFLEEVPADSNQTYLRLNRDKVNEISTAITLLSQNLND